MNDTRTSGASNAVYVQTNASPNEVIAFRRSDDGSLDRIGSVATGGDGSGSPHLQSQGSVALDARWTAPVGHQRRQRRRQRLLGCQRWLA